MNYNFENFHPVIIVVKVKWGKELFPDVEVNTDEEPILFKAQLFALTGVQPERQKVMLKGMTLKDDDWGTIKLRDASDLFIIFFLRVYLIIIIYYFLKIFMLHFN